MVDNVFGWEFKGRIALMGFLGGAMQIKLTRVVHNVPGSACQIHSFLG